MSWIKKLLGIKPKQKRKQFSGPNDLCGGELKPTESELCYDCEYCGKRWTGYWVNKYGFSCNQWAYLTPGYKH
jgi:hypothetical protein